MSVGGVFSLPDGLDMAGFRRHPITATIQDAAQGGRRGLPTAGELDRLKLSPELRGRVKRACAAVATMNDHGDQKDAWHAGYEAAAEVLARLPAAQVQPSFYEAELIADTSDPRELADRVHRRAYGF